jgi:hypothetical protein
MDKLKKYFDLGLFPERIQLGKKDKNQKKKQKRKKIKWTLFMYLGVWLGVVSSYLIDPDKMLDPELGSFNLAKFISSIIVATFIFPFVYKKANFDTNKPNVIQIIIAFQYGLFWHVIFQAFRSGKLINQ